MACDELDQRVIDIALCR